MGELIAELEAQIASGRTFIPADHPWSQSRAVIAMANELTTLRAKLARSIDSEQSLLDNGPCSAS